VDDRCLALEVDRARRVAYPEIDDDFHPHLVGLAPRAERKRRLLTQRPSTIRFAPLTFPRKVFLLP
jgi:hypothetical protein